MNFTVYEMVAFELFGGDTNETLKKLSPYRNIPVVDQLIDTRQNWSPILNENYSNYNEINLIIKTVLQKVESRNSFYRENTQKNIAAFSDRPFNFGSFASFLNLGKIAYQNEITMIKKSLREQQEQEQEQQEQEYGEYDQYYQDEQYQETEKPFKLKVFPAHYGAIPQNSFEKELNLQDFVKYIENNFSYSMKDVEETVDFLLQGNMLEVPLISSSAGVVQNIKNIPNVIAASFYNIKNIPVIFHDDSGKIKKVELSSRKMNLDIQVVLDKSYISKISDTETIEKYLKHNDPKKIQIQWIKGDFRFEMNEFKRVAKEFEYKIKDLEELYKKSKIIELNDSMWKSMENTDSWKTKTLKDLEAKSKEYGRDHIKIIKEFLDKNKQYCPIVIQFPDENKTLHLVAGNTRLMTCRALGVRPKIILIDGQIGC